MRKGGDSQGDVLMGAKTAPASALESPIAGERNLNAELIVCRRASERRLLWDLRPPVGLFHSRGVAALIFPAMAIPRSRLFVEFGVGSSRYIAPPGASNRDTKLSRM